MFQLTVGYVAGIIAAGMFLARIWAPNTITFIVSAILGNKASASTWNAAARAFQQSHWPDLLRTDSVIKRGVRLDILLLTRLMTLIGGLIAIAGVVTPLGLYQDLQPSKNIETPFQYLKDTSPFGYGTPPRSNYSFSRTCGGGFGGPMPCPFTETYSIMTAFPNGTVNWNYPKGININIPKVIKETFSSGTNDSTTVSNYFDIQYRRYMTTQKELYNNGSIFLVGAFRSMQSLVLNNAQEPVEGLIVDTVNGGVGLRNHTIPPGFQHGVTWKEDILFIEPETVCVDTNLTIDFEVAINGSSYSMFENVVLTDRGGFVNLNHTYPLYNLSDPQGNSDLAGRAYKAAWLNNALTALFYNVTNPKNETTGARSFSYLNSAMNKKFPLPGDGPFLDSSIQGLDALDISTTYGDYLSAAWDSVSNQSKTGVFSNPFHITDDNFTDISIICSGAGSADYANITNILVGCGLMRGVPRRTSPGSNLVFDSSSSWSQPLYTCASAVKATVKTVSFNYNGTDGLLKSLAVVDIKDKNYTSEADMPLWGVEDNGNTYRADELALIWGLLSPDYEKKPNVTTVRQPSLYLPGWMDPRFGGPPGPAAKGYANLPGSDFHVSSLGVAYKVGGSSDNSDVDYTGSASMAMWTRWQDLTSNAKTAALIPNLIFTDVAAASIVGTKGVLGPGNNAQKNMVALPVTPTVLKIRYHYLYAIPALLAALLLILITCLALLVTCFRGFGFHRMRIHLQNVSPGRIYTTFLYPGPGGMTMKARDWVKTLGRKQVDLAGDYPLPGESISLLRAPEKGVTVTSYEHPGLDTDEGDVLMGRGHTRETSQGDIGYGFAQPQQYHSQYVGVPQQSVSPGNLRY